MHKGIVGGKGLSLGSGNKRAITAHKDNGLLVIRRDLTAT